MQTSTLLWVSLALALGNDLEIVSCHRDELNPRFTEYVQRFPVSPDDARRTINEHAKASGDADLVDRMKFIKLEGIVNGEYIFINPSTIKKTHFVFFGYHVNVYSGEVRYLRQEDIKFEYGGRFPNGYGAFGRIDRFYVPLE